MDIFLIIVTAYVLPIIFVKFLNKLSIKLFYEDLTDFTNVLEFYMPVYNIFVALAMLVVFVGTLCFEIYDECKCVGPRVACNKFGRDGVWAFACVDFVVGHYS